MVSSYLMNSAYIREMREDMIELIYKSADLNNMVSLQ